MTKAEAKSMDTEMLIKSIAVNNSKETKSAVKAMNICIEELANRNVVNAEYLKNILGL